ncbi:MAG: phosphoribosylglycinamide formyltransferase [Phycisphaeraceae bacterium]
MPDPTSQTPRTPRLMVAISGGGTTLLNLQDRIDAGQLDASIVHVIASNPKAYETIRQTQRFAALGLYRSKYDNKAAYSKAFFAFCRDCHADLVVLAGFLSLLVIPDDFQGRVLNIHPSLLPKFGGKGMHGRHVHQAVIDAGETTSGCTVHLADNTYDTGPTLLQKTCPVHPGDTPDTLAKRVFALECQAYPQAITEHWEALTQP